MKNWAWMTAMMAALLTACGGSGSDDPRGNVLSSARTAALTRSDVDAAVTAAPGMATLIGNASQCDVALHKVTYQSIDPKGTPARASMGVLVPSRCNGPYPIVLYHHGTQLLKSFAMSDPTNLETFLAMAYFASQGYAVVMPDYLGYGDTSLSYHPYLDAQSMGDTSVDALRAGKRFLGDSAVPTSNKLFLTGYSQGGHSTMATQRSIERDHAAEFTVTATAPMAGFYSLSTTFVDAIDAPTDFASILFAYGITALQKDYGDLYATPSAAFQSPWSATVESLIPGTVDVPQILTTGQLPLAIVGTGGLLTDAYAAVIKGDPNSPVRRRLAQNDMTAWTPRAPLTMCHGSRDTIVPIKNMLVAHAAFSERKAQTVAVDIEAIPAFKASIDAQVAAAGTLQVYHAQIAPPFCFSVTKNQVFDPLR